MRSRSDAGSPGTGAAPGATPADLDRLADALVELLVAAWHRRRAQVESGERAPADRTEAA